MGRLPGGVLDEFRETFLLKSALDKKLKFSKVTEGLQMPNMISNLSDA